jgi:hypothetical protein
VGDWSADRKLSRNGLRGDFWMMSSKPTSRPRSCECGLDLTSGLPVIHPQLQATISLVRKFGDQVRSECKSHSPARKEILIIAVGSIVTIKVMPARVKSRSVTKRHHAMPLAFSVMSWQRKDPASEYWNPVPVGIYSG